MGYQTTSGARIAIGPLPATLDLPGFTAVITEDIGGVTDIGAIGKLWNTASISPLADEQVIELKTSYNLQHPELTLALDEGNAGQDAALAASEVHDKYTILITRQDGERIYFTSQVTSFTSEFGNHDFENGSIGLLAQTAPVKGPALP